MATSKRLLGKSMLMFTLVYLVLGPIYATAKHFKIINKRTIQFRTWATTMTLLGAITVAICTSGNTAGCITGSVISVAYAVAGNVYDHYTGLGGTATVVGNGTRLSTYVSVGGYSVHTANDGSEYWKNAHVTNSTEAITGYVRDTYGQWHQTSGLRKGNASMVVSTPVELVGASKRQQCNPTSCAVTGSGSLFAMYAWYDDNLHDEFYATDNDIFPSQVANELIADGIYQYGVYCLNVKEWEGSYPHLLGGTLLLASSISAYNIYNPTQWAAQCNGGTQYWEAPAMCSDC